MEDEKLRLECLELCASWDNRTPTRIVDNARRCFEFVKGTDKEGQLFRLKCLKIRLQNMCSKEGICDGAAIFYEFVKGGSATK